MKLPAYLTLMLTIFLLACSAETAPEADMSNETSSAVATEKSIEMGSLAFVANGEDFVREGFSTKDGWHIEFEHLYLTFAEITAYQTEPPYDASSGELPRGDAVVVAGPITVDLALGDEDAEPILIATVDAPVGLYNALGWQMVPTESADSMGATISLIGTAQKNDQIVSFAINDPRQYSYNCGEFVGDARKGIVQAGDTAHIEATFHFDHLFGDAEVPADDALNIGALGFEPLAEMASDEKIEISVTDLEGQLSGNQYDTLVESLASLGHVGEGHCYEASGGYTGHLE